MSKTETINNYTENEELRALINEYCTNKALEYVQYSLRVLNRLTSDETEKIAILKQSISNGWRGLYKVANLK